MRQRGGPITEPEWTVEASLKRLADDIGLLVATVKTTRWVASRWPKEHRSPKTASYTVHRALANIEAETERFAAIGTPPVVEEFTRDESVAATAATNLLRRPDVAFRAMSDDIARFQVNHAQVERGRQARDDFDRTSPVAPAVRAIDRSVEFLDLVTACHSCRRSRRPHRPRPAGPHPER
ncbi:DUF6192 family protein [Streptomyces sparsogenes]